MTKSLVIGLIVSATLCVPAFAGDSLVVKPGDRLFVFEGKGAARYETAIVQQNPPLKEENRRMRLNNDQILVVLSDATQNFFSYPTSGENAVLNGLGPSALFRQTKGHETLYLPTSNEKLRKVIVGTGATVYITRTKDGSLSVSGTKIVADDKREIERGGIVGNMPPYDKK